MSFQNKYRTLPRKVSLYNVNINVCKNNKKKNILQEKRIFFIHSIVLVVKTVVYARMTFKKQIDCYIFSCPRQINKTKN